MGNSNIMIKLCVFDTFEACREAQHYDHLYQKAINLATVTGIDSRIIRDNNLHVQDELGVFPLDQYIIDNNIELQYPQEYEHAKYCWRNTTGWSPKYKLGDEFVYFKDHSDRTYEIIEVDSLVDCIPLDDNGDEIVFL
jgi:hypothetical protein